MSLIGIDEAGRGALAGPLFVAACEFKKGFCPTNLRDSKKLSPKKRSEFASLVKEHSNYLILSFSHEQIDTLSLSFCLKTALLLIKKHFIKGDFLYDGNTDFGVCGIKTLIKADESVAEVSAASILAKVSRDEFMINLKSKYPAYEFEKHKGYGTKAHIQIIEKLGLSKIHRKSFKLKSLEASLF